jgi:hypothetical protein
MQDDVRKLIFGLLGLFILVLIIWIGFVFVSGCGFSLDCEKAAVLPDRTPIPTLIPAGMPLPDFEGDSPGVACQVTAVGLIQAWVSSGYSETDPFIFTDANGLECTANFTQDVQQLFLEGNLWYTGAPACTTCHNTNLNEATAALDLSSYQGMLLGSRRTGDSAGNDIFGGGNWESSQLYNQLYVLRAMPQGRPADVPSEGPVIFTGSAEEN